MSTMLGFWSYVHADDTLDFGRVSQLARDIVNHYEAIRAEKIELFLDRDDLAWGDKWRDKIDEALSNVAFFVPVLTPRYFNSIECRRELQFFLDRTRALGITDLVMPILYIDVPQLLEDSPNDALIEAVKPFQWKPWQDFRFAERDSGSYRSAVNQLAVEIGRRVDSVEAADVVAAAKEVAAALPHDDLGILDRLAALEEAAPRWTEGLTAIGIEVERIGEMMRRATVELNSGDSQGKGFAARLTIARRVATELDNPVGRIEKLTEAWLADLNSIDTGIRTILEDVPEQYEKNPESTLNFLELLRQLSLSSNQGLGAAGGLVQAVEQASTTSKDLRPVLRRLRTSMRSMAEARTITDRWLTLVDETQLLPKREGLEANPTS